MSTETRMSRRQLLRRAAVLGAGLAAAAPILAACGPTPTPQVIKEVVKETVVVEKPVEKVVEKEITKIVAGTPVKEVVKEVVKETVVVEKPVEKVVEKVVTPTPAKKEMVTLRMHNASAYLAGFEEKYADKLFKQKFPNIEVKHEIGVFAEFVAQLLTLKTANKLGDALSIGIRGGRWYVLRQKEVIQDLDAHVKADGYDLGQFFPVAIEQAKWQGKLVGLPNVLDPGLCLLAYNQDMYDAAKLKYPDESWTLDKEFVEAATKLTLDKNKDGKIDQWGYAINPDYWGMRCLIISYGGDVLSEDGKKCTLDSKPCREALQWMFDMRFKWKVAPLATQVEGDQEQMFVGQKLAQKRSWMGDYGYYKSLVKDQFKFSFAALPKSPYGKYGALTTEWIVSMTSQTQHPKEAFEYMKHLCSYEICYLMLQSEIGEVSGRPDVWTDPHVQAIHPIYKIGYELMKVMKFHTFPANLRVEEFWSTLDQGIGDVFLGKEDLDTGIKRAQKVIQEILDKPMI